MGGVCLESGSTVAVKGRIWMINDADEDMNKTSRGLTSWVYCYALFILACLLVPRDCDDSRLRTTESRFNQAENCPNT